MHGQARYLPLSKKLDQIKYDSGLNCANSTASCQADAGFRLGVSIDVSYGDQIRHCRCRKNVTTAVQVSKNVNFVRIINCLS